MMEKRWICLSEKCFVDFIDYKSVFMYNTEQHSMLSTENLDFIMLVQELQSPANLGSVEIGENRETDSTISEALSKELLYIENSVNKPLIFLPILNLQRDLERGDSIESQISIMGNKARFVTGINICINIPFSPIGSKVDSLRMEAISQTFVSSSNLEKSKSLSYGELEQILSSLFATSIKNVDLIFNLSLMRLDEIERLSYLLVKYPYDYRIHSYIDGVDLQTIETLSRKKISLSLYFDRYTASLENQKSLETTIIAKLDNVSVTKFVYDKEDMEADSQIALKPIFTKDNIAFFKEHIYLSARDIMSIRPTMKEIMRNTKLNYNFFGILDVLPDGSVLAHGSSVCIGNIANKNFIVESVIDEFRNNRSWRLTRDLVNCRICKFRYICPPISAIEIASHEFNICNL
ncbi:hypothetical protein [Porphyromonas gulae]|uniref:hypothetical protein n=1 Tax=Porphyromonas gulae TaxID=111105 RepID=UPI00037217B3|nr:hypothetical protein [Porphyromonas gulae]